jgi:hypothetical protein
MKMQPLLGNFPYLTMCIIHLELASFAMAS